MPRPAKPLNPYASWAALFGATVQQLRAQARLTQDQLGARIGYDGSTVSAVERAVRRPDEAFMLACEAHLPAGGMLRAMHPFVVDDWQQHERHGLPLAAVGVPIPPAEVLAGPLRPGQADRLELAVDAATEAMELTRHAGASDLGAGTLEQLELAVDQCCRDYSSTLPAVLAPRVQRRLRYAVGLLDAKTTLAEHRHLLVAGGWLALLLACLEFDLGDREAARATRQTAFQLAREAGHRELLAWTLEAPAWFALFDDRAREAVELARAAQQVAPVGTSAQVAVTLQEARAWARLGGGDQAEAAMRRAGAALARLPVPEHPEHHFAFDAPKLSFYAATSYIWLGRPERAEEHARQVIAQCEPAIGPDRWPRRVATARVDLALAAVQLGRADEACQLGAEALDTACLSRSTVRRAGELDELLQRRHAELPEARDYHERYLAARGALVRPAAQR